MKDSMEPPAAIQEAPVPGSYGGGYQDYGGFGDFEDLFWQLRFWRPELPETAERCGR